MSVFYYCCLSVVVRTLDKPCIVAYIMSHFYVIALPYIAYLFDTPSPKTMAGATASVKGMGGIITTVRLAFAGLCLVLSSSPR